VHRAFALAEFRLALCNTRIFVNGIGYHSASRPKKPLHQKILEGTTKKHKPKVLDMPSLEDAFEILKPPDYMEYYSATHVSEHCPTMVEVFAKTEEWLRNTGCLHLINPEYIKEYVVCKTRWLECEDVVAAVLHYVDKSGNLVPSPMIESSMKYLKAADTAWAKIWNIIAANSETYFGDDPNTDIMAFLIRNKPDG
jgi:hypothetical protein